MKVYESLIQSAKRWPNKAAIIDQEGELSFEDLLTKVELLKNELISRGYGSGHGLAICTNNDRQFLIALYAALGTGAIVMPISIQQKESEIKTALKDAKLHAILTTSKIVSKYGIDNQVLGVFDKEFYLSRTKRELNEPTVEIVKDAAFMRFTSGTTGLAKGVVISHQSVFERIQSANEVLQLGEKDRVLWVLPMAYHFVVSIVLYIHYGVGIVVSEDFLAENILDKIKKHDTTFLYASPMHIRLLSAYRGEKNLSNTRLVISTTAGINQQMCQVFSMKYKIPVSQAYGIIEIGLPIINIEQSEDHPEAVGYTLPAYEVGILDEYNKVLADNTIGLLGIRGPGMFDAYLTPPTLRKEVLQNGWFMTGDYALKNEDGLITIKGRKKVMINVSGNKVFPNEVEAVINNYKGVFQSKVSGHEHPLLGELVMAEVVLHPNTDFDQEDLIAHCAKHLSAFKVPQKIKVVEDIEMTGSGKIKR